jgi:hypothetical protein
VEPKKTEVYCLGAVEGIGIGRSPQKSDPDATADFPTTRRAKPASGQSIIRDRI